MTSPRLASTSLPAFVGRGSGAAGFLSPETRRPAFDHVVARLFLNVRAFLLSDAGRDEDRQHLAIGAEADGFFRDFRLRGVAEPVAHIDSVSEASNSASRTSAMSAFSAR